VPPVEPQARIIEEARELVILAGFPFSNCSRIETGITKAWTAREDSSGRPLLGLVPDAVTG
jgi:hypothetical protein